MKRGLTGRYEVLSIGGEVIQAFVPDPLPPKPPLEMTPQRRKLLEEATLSLGRLDSITLLGGDPPDRRCLSQMEKGRGLRGQARVVEVGHA